MHLWYNETIMAYLTIREAAEKTGADEATIRLLIERGLLASHLRIPAISSSTGHQMLAALVPEPHVEEEELYEALEEYVRGLHAYEARLQILRHANTRK